MCEILLKGGAKVNCQDPNGRTPLHVATWKGFYNVVEKLIEYGADINHTDLMGYTPLMTAAWQGHTSVLSLLLIKNAMVDVVSSKDKATALSIAAQEGHEDVVRLLLNNNASVSLTDKFGRNPIKVAQQAGNRGIVQILDAFSSTTINDGTFTNTLKKQFSKLMKATSGDSSQSAVPAVERAQQKLVTRSISNTSSHDKSGSEEYENSNTSISSNDPSNTYEEYCASYCGPCGEISSKMSSSYSSLKQSKTTVLTGSSLDDSVFFSMSGPKDSFLKTPFDFNSGYHGCDAVTLRKALEIPSVETTL